MSKVKAPEWVKKILQLPDKVEEIAVTAGMGTGKTFGIVIAHLALCLINDRSDSLFIEPQYNLIRTVAIPTFQKILDSWELTEGSDYMWRLSSPISLTLKLSEKSTTIYFLSGNTPSSIVGYTVGHATIDEAGQVPELAKNNVLSRMRCPNVLKKRAIFAGTPEGDDSWFCRDFNIPSDVLHDHKIRFKRHTRTNIFHPNITKYIQVLERQWQHAPERLASYLSGDFASFEKGQVFQSFTDANIKPIVNKEFSLDNSKVYLTFDFNAFPLAWILTVVRDGILYCMDCSTAQTRRTLREEVKFILQKYDNIGHWEIFGDRSGHADSHKSSFSDFQIIEDELRDAKKSYEIRAPRTVVPITGSVEIANSLFFKEKIIISESCEQLIRSLRLTKWEENTRKIHKPQGDSWTHWGDSLRYLLYFLVKDETLRTDGEQCYKLSDLNNLLRRFNDL